jgi:hypothetical protein
MMVKSFRSFARVAACFAALLFTATNAGAYAVETAKWTLNRTVSMHLSLGEPQSLSDGFSSFNDSAADALNTWNQYLVHMRFRPIVASSLPTTDGDGETSVFFSRTAYGDAFGDRVLAVTLFASRDSVVSEADVIFNSNYSWDSYRGAQQSSYDFHRVALHEFGHVVGLDHPDQNHPEVGYVTPSVRPPAIMTSVIGNIDSLQTDDINGAHFLYDNGPAYRSSISAPNLVNLSTRGLVGSDSNNFLIGGFIVQGGQPATLVIRAIGHSLAANGIGNALVDPEIDIYNSAGALVGTSDDWIDGGADSATIASYHLDPTNSRESALLRTLNPGSYTIAVHSWRDPEGTNAAELTGTAVVELYDLHTTGGRAGNISTRGQVFSGNDVMVAGFIVGAQSKEVVIRGIGPSLTDAGVANALTDPVLELHDASGNLIRQNDNWETDPEAAAVQSSGLAPSRSNESAIHATVGNGIYTAILRGANSSTGIGLVEVYDLSPAP